MDNETLSNKPTRSTAAIWALVFCFIFPPVGLVLGIIALVGISKSKGQLKGTPLAVVAVIWGTLSLLFLPLVVVPAVMTIIQKGSAPAQADVAKANVNKIYYAVQTNFDKAKALPIAVDWTPATSCCEQGGTCKPSASDWDQLAWKAIGFSITEDSYYQYRIRSETDGSGNPSFAIEARGDLDCDGEYSRFERAAIIVYGNIQGFSGIYVVDELE